MDKYDKIKISVIALGITYLILALIIWGTRPANSSVRPEKAWKIEAGMIAIQGKEIESSLGECHEVEIEGCHYLIWKDSNKLAGNMLHKGNCPNHGPKTPSEEKKPDVDANKLQIKSI